MIYIIDANSVLKTWRRDFLFATMVGLLVLLLIAPQDINAGEVTGTTAVLNWTATGDDGDQGTASVYDIRYLPEPISSSNWDEAIQVANESAPRSSGSSESFTVTGLLPNTEYYFGIQVIDDAGNRSGLSNILSLETSATDLANLTVTDIEVITNEVENLEISWTIPGGSGNLPDSYDLRYSTEVITPANWDDATEVTGEPTPGTPGAVQSVTLTDLTQATVYYFALRVADDQQVWSDLSNLIFVETAFEFGAGTDDELPDQFELSQNYPNPFNPVTTIQYTVANREHVSVAVYNILGQVTRRLVDEVQDPGDYSVIWDGNDQYGRPVATGVYLYRLISDTYNQSRKMVLMK